MDIQSLKWHQNKKTKQDDQKIYEAFLLKHLRATESQDDEADMFFLNELHRSFEKRSGEKKGSEDTNTTTFI